MRLILLVFFMLFPVAALACSPGSFEGPDTEKYVLENAYFIGKVRLLEVGGKVDEDLGQYGWAKYEVLQPYKDFKKFLEGQIITASRDSICTRDFGPIGVVQEEIFFQKDDGAFEVASLGVYSPTKDFWKKIRNETANSTAITAKKKACLGRGGIWKVLEKSTINIEFCSKKSWW